MRARRRRDNHDRICSDGHARQRAQVRDDPALPRLCPAEGFTPVVLQEQVLVEKFWMTPEQPVEAGPSPHVAGSVGNEVRPRPGDRLVVFRALSASVRQVPDLIGEDDRRSYLVSATASGHRTARAVVRAMRDIERESTGALSARDVNGVLAVTRSLSGD
jgi:hypothetical protein